MTEEIVRLGLAALVALGILAAGYLGRRLYARIINRHTGLTAADLADRYELKRGQTTVLYLAGDRCAQCIQLQEPALNRLAEQRGIVVRKLDAPSEPELLGRFNIATVPSTIVVGPDLSVRRVNVGFADAETLEEQIA